MNTISTHQIRWLIRRDMDEVLKIENTSFAIPWVEAEVLILLRQNSIIGMVCNDERQRVQAFCIYELEPGCLRIHRLAVAPQCRRMGIGTAMIERLTDKLSQQRRVKLEVVVPEDNLEAQLFFQRCKMRAVRVVDDGYVFRRMAAK